MFAPFAEALPSSGRALDVACGLGGASAWLARRGLDVRGVDGSATAIERARRLCPSCRFDVWDLDDGLPPGPPVEVLLCHLFRDVRLDAAMRARLAPGGVLLIAALDHGRFGVAPGELRAAFASLDVLGEGPSWLVATLP